MLVCGDGCVCIYQHNADYTGDICRRFVTVLTGPETRRHSAGGPILHRYVSTRPVVCG